MAPEGMRRREDDPIHGVYSEAPWHSVGAAGGYNGLRPIYGATEGEADELGNGGGRARCRGTQGAAAGGSCKTNQ